MFPGLSTSSLCQGQDMACIQGRACQAEESLGWFPKGLYNARRKTVQPLPPVSHTHTRVGSKLRLRTHACTLRKYNRSVCVCDCACAFLPVPVPAAAGQPPLPNVRLPRSVISLLEDGARRERLGGAELGWI